MEHESNNDSNNDTNNDANNKPVELFIHGLHPDATIEDIRLTFSPICKILNISFKKHPITGKHKGYAFLKVPNRGVADEILSSGHVLKGRTVYCQLKQKNVDMNAKRKKRLFVGGIPVSVKDKDLKKIFEKFGTVMSAYTIRDYNGKSKYFGYVDFKTEEGAKKTLESLPIFAKGRRLDVKRFERDEKREKIKQMEIKRKEELEVQEALMKMMLGEKDIDGQIGIDHETQKKIKNSIGEKNTDDEKCGFNWKNAVKEVVLFSKFIPKFRRNVRLNWGKEKGGSLARCGWGKL